MAERSFALTGLASYCKKAKALFRRSLGLEKRLKWKLSCCSPCFLMCFGISVCIWVSILYMSNFSDCRSQVVIQKLQYVHIHYFFSSLPLLSWFRDKASWAEPRSTLAQNSKNWNISFPRHMLLQSKDRKYKLKEFSSKKKIKIVNCLTKTTASTDLSCSAWGKWYKIMAASVPR